MQSIERAWQLMKSPRAEWPPVAAAYLRFVTQKVGACAEVYLTAFAQYAEAMEHCAPTPGYALANDDDARTFFAGVRARDEADRAAKPQRIQLRRTKGWKLPARTVRVGRPTPWGNPFSVQTHGRTEALRLYRHWLDASLPGQEIKEKARQELRGLNLACWCPLDQPCHADILLAIANVPEACQVSDKHTQPHE